MKKASFLQMLKQGLFPHFRFKSFTFLLICAHIYMFCMCYYIGNGEQDSPQAAYFFLTIPQRSLFICGEKYPYFIIKELEIWRLFSNSFLTSNFYHLFVVLLTLLILGSYLEKKIGCLFYTYLLFYSTLSTTILACLISDDPAIGGSFFSIAITGFIELQTFYYLRQEFQGLLKEDEWINLMQFPKKHSKEFHLVILTIFFLNFAVSLTNQGNDIFGNGVAFLNGSFMGWILLGNKKKSWSLFTKIVPLLIIATLSMGLLFRNPNLL